MILEKISIVDVSKFMFLVKKAIDFCKKTA